MPYTKQLEKEALALEKEIEDNLKEVDKLLDDTVNQLIRSVLYPAIAIAIAYVGRGTSFSWIFNMVVGFTSAMFFLTAITYFYMFFEQRKSKKRYYSTKISKSQWKKIKSSQKK